MQGRRLRPEVGNSRTRIKSPGSAVGATVDTTKTDALNNSLQALLDADKGKTMHEFSDTAMEAANDLPADLPSLPVDPFFAKAEAEAADDQLCGINRSQEWIRKRAKQIADEDFGKPVGDPSRIGQEYYKLDMITDMMSAGDENSLPPRTQEKFNAWMADHLKKKIDKFCETYKPEDLYRKQLQEDNEIILKAEKKKISKDQQDAALMTLTFIKSSLFCLMIPIASFLPHPWNMLQLACVLYVFWMNWPALAKLRKVMREIKERDDKEKKEKQVKQEFGSDVYGSVNDRAEKSASYQGSL